MISLHTIYIQFFKEYCTNLKFQWISQVVPILYVDHECFVFLIIKFAIVLLSFYYSQSIKTIITRRRTNSNLNVLRKQNYVNLFVLTFSAFREIWSCLESFMQAKMQLCKLHLIMCHALDFTKYSLVIGHFTV